MPCPLTSRARTAEGTQRIAFAALQHAEHLRGSALAAHLQHAVKNGSDSVPGTLPQMLEDYTVLASCPSLLPSLQDPGIQSAWQERVKVCHLRSPTASIKTGCCCFAKEHSRNT